MPTPDILSYNGPTPPVPEPPLDPWAELHWRLNPRTARPWYDIGPLVLHDDTSSYDGPVDLCPDFSERSETPSSLF